MKISSLHIQDFRNHFHTAMQLDRMTIVRGPNHSGKSSIAQAIEFALTGRTEASDDGYLSDLIRMGEEKTVIALSGNDGGEPFELRAALTPKSGRMATALVGELKDAAREVGNYWLTSLNNRKELFSCLLNPHYFVNLRPADQKNVLARIILPLQHDWDKERVADAELVGINARLNWCAHPFTVIEQGYKLAYEARTGINRALKEFIVPKEPEHTITPNITAIEEKIAGLRTELAAKRAEHTRVATYAATLEERRANADEREAAADTALAELQIAYEKLPAQKTKKDLDTLKKTADKAKDDAALSVQITEISAKQAAGREELQRLQRLEAEARCPTCEQSITAELMKELYKPILDKLKALDDEVAKLWLQRKGLGDIEGAKAELERQKDSDRERKTMLKQIEDASVALRGARTDKEAVSAAPGDTALLDAEISTLQGRIDAGQVMLNNAHKFMGALNGHKAAKERFDLMTEQQAALERLVDYFGPNGVKAELIAEHVGGFTESLNNVLRGWGYTAQLVIEPYQFLVRQNGIDGVLSLHQLSQSELYRFSVAFQVALAMASEVEMCVIDGADILDTVGRRDLFRALYNSELEQAIVLLTDDKTTVPDMPNTLVYMLGTGTNGVAFVDLLKKEEVAA